VKWRWAAVPVALMVAAGCAAGGSGARVTSTTTSTLLAEPVATSTAPTTAVVTAPDLPIEESLRLGEGGLGRARFGDSDAKVEPYLRSILLNPDDDTDWGKPENAYGTCPGTEARAIRWGYLVVFFSDRSDFGVGRRHFIGWRYGPDVDSQSLYPDGLSTVLGLRPGMTVSELRKTFEATELSQATATAPARFRLGSSFAGSLSGLADDDVVTLIEAGTSCPL